MQAAYFGNKYLAASMAYCGARAIYNTQGATYKKYNYDRVLEDETPILIVDRTIITAFNVVTGPIRFPFALLSDIMRAECHMRSLDYEKYNQEYVPRNVDFCYYLSKL